MTAAGERQGPATCPACSALLAAVAEPHCPPPKPGGVRRVDGSCTWWVCRCGAIIDPDGRHIMGPKPTRGR